MPVSMVKITIFSCAMDRLHLGEFKKGYSNKAIFDEKFKRRLLLHKIALQIGYLAHHIKENMTYEAKFAYQRLKESLKEL